MSGIMENYRIQKCEVHELLRIWPKAKDFIASALTFGEFDLDDVLMRLVEERIALFVAWHGEIVIGAATAEIVAYPRKTVGVIAHMGAKDLAKVLPFLHYVERWLRSMGAESIRVLGRRGWERVLVNHGYKYLYTCVEKL